mgnify:CR=1 FL=1
MGLNDFMVVGFGVLVVVVLAFAFGVFRFMQRIILDERQRHAEIEKELLNRIMAAFPGELRNFTQAQVQQETFRPTRQDEEALRALAEDKLYGADTSGRMIE